MDAPNATTSTTSTAIRYEDPQLSSIEHPFYPEQGSVLDSSSQKFLPRQWLQALQSLESRTVPSLARGKVGVAFRSLSVSGKSGAAEFHKTVGNIFFAVPAMLATWISPVKHPSRVLLDGFEGMVCPGEMLLVLGAPGSGCSTFLRTIAGDLEGLTVDTGSYVNYQGPYHLTKIINANQ